jgi:hypothetical protein
MHLDVRDRERAMSEPSSFDQAWAAWRLALTEEIGTAGLPTRIRQLLQESNAFDPGDGLIDQNWAMELMTEGEPVRRLRAQGLRDAEVDQLVDLVRRHPLPAAGG